MPIPMGLIMAFVAVMVLMLIAIPIMSEVSDTLECPTGQRSKECQSVKDNMWNLIAIMPIAIILLIIPMVLGMENPISKLFDRKVKSRTKNMKNLSLFAKILLYLGLAKLKE